MTTNRSKLEELVINRLKGRGWTDNLLVDQIALIERDSTNVPLYPDVILQVYFENDLQPLPLAVIEVKSTSGLSQAIEQAKAMANYLSVPYAIATDGEKFCIIDRPFRDNRPANWFNIENFPTPDELRSEYKGSMERRSPGFDIRPLITKYVGGYRAPQPHQDAAIRAALEAVTLGQKRILIQMASGTGKTFVMANFLRRSFDSALFANALIVTHTTNILRQFLHLTHELLDIQTIESNAEDQQVRKQSYILTYAHLSKILSKDADWLKNFSVIVFDEIDSYSGGLMKFGADHLDVVMLTIVSTISTNLKHLFGSAVYQFSAKQALDYGFLKRPKEKVVTKAQKELLIPARNPPNVVTGKPLSDKELTDSYRIFISYRRDDSYDMAHKLYDRLKTEFILHKIFIDTEVIKPGDNFKRMIFKAIDESHLILVLIGKSWLYIPNAKQQRRLDDPNDTVRQEIEYALSKEKIILPILINKADMPAESDLPDSPIRQLTHHSGIEIVHKAKYFDSELQDLAKEIRDILTRTARLND